MCLHVFALSFAMRLCLCFRFSLPTVQSKILFCDLQKEWSYFSSDKIFKKNRTHINKQNKNISQSSRKTRQCFTCVSYTVSICFHIRCIYVAHMLHIRITYVSQTQMCMFHTRLVRKSQTYHMRFTYALHMFIIVYLCLHMFYMRGHLRCVHVPLIRFL